MRRDQAICSEHGWTKSSDELARLAGQIDWDFIDGEIAPLDSDRVHRQRQSQRAL